MTDPIRVILFKEDNTWVAQGLEHDICVQAEKLDDLYGRFEVAVRLEGEESGGVERLPQAPKHFFEMWDRKAADVQFRDRPAENLSYGLAA